MKKVAIVGNPNSGKSTLFSKLTGVRQKVSNFPGVTVEKKSGKVKLPSGEEIILTDLPGTYSLFPSSQEERLVVNILTNSQDAHFPDFLVYVADISQLERHLLLAMQIRQLGIPMCFIANMSDLATVGFNSGDLEKLLGVPVIVISAKKPEDIDRVKSFIEEELGSADAAFSGQRMLTYPMTDAEKSLVDQVMKISGQKDGYTAKLMIHHRDWLEIASPFLTDLNHLAEEKSFVNMDSQVREVNYWYSQYLPVIQKLRPKPEKPFQKSLSTTDKIVIHPVFGPLLFFAVMFFVFQAIYAWASYPMDWIEGGFSTLSIWLDTVLPKHFLSELFIHGMVAGLGGVLVFIPQIVILFLLINMLEESGYMSRAVFMFDQIMRKFGLNGRSMVSLISSGACAIPAIMSARTISNPRERLLTIMVSPLISCSARLPVYAVLVGFVVPDVTIWGLFNAPGLVFMGLYLLGIVAALASAWVFSRIIKTKEVSSLILELPAYKTPDFRNVWLSTREKAMSFVREAGKVILLISIIIWGLSSYGPGHAMEKAEEQARVESREKALTAIESEQLISQYQLESSFAGYLGKFIEPVITPLGYDWKIGIALITSFAAREVFVGTMATIYSIGQEDETATLRQKMKKEKKKDGITPMYNPATALSLLLFYVFALQCMSTLAVTRKETGSWKWPMIQFAFMGVLAYMSAWVAYVVMS